MNEIFLKDDEIKEIFKTHLKIESKVMSIETLFANERRTKNTVYDPYYQRNYVWDNDKATYFIESILLGTEIPPLVFFNTGKQIEVIDGRQRFETIKRFKEGKFHLTKKGLSIFKELAKKNFDDFSLDLQDVFWDTKLRIIEFSVVNEPTLDEVKEDKIKKEIFRRYNSGITPLKNAEIEKAMYIHDDTISYFKMKFKEFPEVYHSLLSLFFTERDMELSGKSITLEKVMQKLRTLLVLHNVPIYYYSTCKNRKEIIQKFFEQFSHNEINIELLFEKFNKKLNFLVELKNDLNKQGISSNKLVYECLFWALTILEQENGLWDKDKDTEIKKHIIEFLKSNLAIYNLENSHFYKEMKERYTGTAELFENITDVKFDIYLKNNNTQQVKIKTLMNEGPDTSTLIEEFETLRLNKPDASTTTIDDICRLMGRKRFLLRPSYQRSESINQMKAAAIIESILLGIKLPPLFIFKRNDGILEVVDGQQRLLSILGFIGESFLEENGKRLHSEKNNFKLNNLRILTDLNGKKYNELSDDYKEKILDFNLSLVTIDSKINPTFDPIDLFLRLNNKPYPIRENTFEMWNSYIDNEIIKEIKKVNEKYEAWFYSRIKNTRMENEELITTLSYFEYKGGMSESDEFLDIYQKNNKITSRVKSKGEITKILNMASENELIKNNFLKCLSKADAFIKKIKLILIDSDIDLEKENEFLKDELDKVFNILHSKSARRTLQNFYLLWFIVSKINFEMVKKNRIQIKSELIDIFKFSRDVQKEIGTTQNGMEAFKERIELLIEKYKVDDRKITLSKDEKLELIKKQNNICPICNALIFINDDIEVDHSVPLAIGGKDKYLNLKVAHKECNRKKGVKLNRI